MAQPKKDVDWLPQSQAKGNFFIEAGMWGLNYITKRENAAVSFIWRKIYMQMLLVRCSVKFQESLYSSIMFSKPGLNIKLREKKKRFRAFYTYMPHARVVYEGVCSALS